MTSANVVAILGGTLGAALPFVLHRLVSRSPRMRELARKGVLLGEDSFELTCYLRMGSMRLRYADVRSVQVLPYHRYLAGLLLRHYGLRSWCGSPFWPFRKVVVVELGGRRVFRYQLFAPRDATGVAAELWARVERHRTSGAGRRDPPAPRED